MESMRTKNSVSVEVTPLSLECIDALIVRGFFKSREHAFEKALEFYLSEEILNKTLKTVEGMEITAGKKFDVKVDAPSRHVTTK